MSRRFDRRGRPIRCRCLTTVGTLFCITLLAIFMYCENSVPTADAWMFDRPHPGTHRAQLQLQRHLKMKTTGPTTRRLTRTRTLHVLFEKDGDDTDNDDKDDGSMSKIVDKLTDEQRQALLQMNMKGDQDDDDNARDDGTIAKQNDGGRRNLMINGAAAALAAVTAVAATNLYTQTVYTPVGFKRFSNIQFIAATGDPDSNQGVIGNGPLEQWGVWNKDPGPRGVYLRDYKTVLEQSDVHVAPAGWKFDKNDWWLEEHGIIMEAPRFPLPAGRYLVTGGRMVTTGLTIDAKGRWELDDNHTLYEVTHLPCRSARYRPAGASASTTAAATAGSPETARTQDFPVAPGAIMPAVPGCEKQDYAVLFLLGKAVTT